MCSRLKFCFGKNKSAFFKRMHRIDSRALLSESGGGGGTKYHSMGVDSEILPINDIKDVKASADNKDIGGTNRGCFPT